MLVFMPVVSLLQLKISRRCESTSLRWCCTVQQGC